MVQPMMFPIGRCAQKLGLCFPFFEVSRSSGGLAGSVLSAALFLAPSTLALACEEMCGSLRAMLGIWECGEEPGPQSDPAKYWKGLGFPKIPGHLHTLNSALSPLLIHGAEWQSLFFFFRSYLFQKEFMRCHKSKIR